MHRLFSRLSTTHSILLMMTAIATATVFRLALTPIFGSGYTFIAFYPAIMFSTVIAGWKYGLAATLMSMVLSGILFLDPMTNAEHATALLVFLGLNGLMIFLVEITGRVHRQAELQTKLALVREQELRETEAKYQYIFESAAVSIWEEDWSAVKVALDELREQEAMTDLRKYLESHPAVVRGTIPLVKIRDVNPESVRLFKANSKEELLTSLEKIFVPETADVFLEELVAIAEGRDMLDHQAPLQTLTGEPLTVRFSLVAPKRDPQWRRVLVTLTDITAQVKTEAALRESELRFRTLVEGIGDVFWIVDPNQGKVIYASQAFEEIWGRNVQQLYDYFQTWFEAIHEEDRERVRNEFFAHIHAGGYDSEYRVVQPDGTIRWVRDCGKPLGIGNLVAGVAEDITDYKRAEEAVRNTGEQFRSILDRAPAAIFLKDRAGRYLFFNDQFARLFQFERESAYGKTDEELLPAELAHQFVSNDRQVWESGTLLTIEEYVPQVDGRHTSLVQKFLLRDADGNPYALCGIALDITDRLKMEAAIRAGEERLQLAQTAGGVGTFDWDIVAQRGVWSPELERIWGLLPGSFDGSYAAWRRLVYPEDLAAAEAGAARSMEDPSKPQEYEYRIMRPDGALRWVYAKAKTLCDAEGRRIRMVGVNMDITDRKEAQLRLEQSTEELEREVEARTKELVQSQNRLRAMATELNLTEQRERKRLATELHDHLQQMLVFGKLTIGQGKQAAIGIPACEKVFNKVDEMLSDALSYTRTLVSELSPPVLRDHGLIAGLKWLGESMKKHELSVAVIVPEDNGLKLPEDQEILLFQTVRELLINSSKHAGVGQATVRLVQYDDCLEITVRDEGNGFDLAAAGTSGSGLSSKFGLFSIRERMRALGGSFAIDSAPRQGTTATIMLRVPRRPDSTVLNSEGFEAPDSALGLQHSSHLKNTATRVLLVDDHAMVREGLRTVLDAYKDLQVVGEGRDGEEAVKLVQELQPRVVVMDINMPKMNGIDATARIKAKWPGTIVIGISVNTGDDNSDAMKRAGAITVLTKDKAVDQLHDAIIHEVGASAFNLT